MSEQNFVQVASLLDGIRDSIGDANVTHLTIAVTGRLENDEKFTYIERVDGDDQQINSLTSTAENFFKEINDSIGFIMANVDTINADPVTAAKEPQYI